MKLSNFVRFLVLCGMSALRADIDLTASRVDAVSVASHNATATQSCGPVAVTPASQTTGPISVKKYDASCDVPSGGYVMVFGSYRLHAQSTLAGSCQTRTLDQGQCVNVSLFERYHGAVKTYVNGVFEGNLPVDYWVKEMDTTTTPPLNTTSGDSWSPVSTGTYTYTALGTALDSGGCGFPTSWAATNSVTMHAVRCKPEWYLAGNPLVNVHVPIGKVYLYIPTSMRDRMVGTNVPPNGPAVLAIQAWNAVLTSLGIEFEITDSTSTCGSGGDCIEMQTTSNTIQGCADIAPSSINLTTGIIQGVSTMRFPADTWSKATDTRLQRSVAHELGHILGLNHNLCSVANSIMSTAGTSCTAADSGMALGPTTTDVLPIVNSTYGDQVRASCGF